MEERKDRPDCRAWTDEEIARAKVTEPPSPCSYTSPAAAYELHAGDIHFIDPKFNFDLPRLPQNRE
jgi:hypothetical protein